MMASVMQADVMKLYLMNAFEWRCDRVDHPHPGLRRTTIFDQG
jgi:hypothetical protein